MWCRGRWQGMEASLQCLYPRLISAREVRARRSDPSLYRPGTYPGSQDVKAEAGPRIRNSWPLCLRLLSPLHKCLPLLQ